MCICAHSHRIKERKGNNDGGYAVSDYLNIETTF